MQTLNYSVKMNVFWSGHYFGYEEIFSVTQTWETKCLTNVYSWPQYIFVPSGKDMSFLREDSICDKDNLLFTIERNSRKFGKPD